MEEHGFPLSPMAGDVYFFMRKAEGKDSEPLEQPFIPNPPPSLPDSTPREGQRAGDLIASGQVQIELSRVSLRKSYELIRKVQLRIDNGLDHIRRHNAR